MSNLKTPLREIFGFNQFRAGQQDIVEAVCAGKNVLAIMPTGGGKSLCYQLPALLLDGLTVVISPLIALMRDQVRALEANGVAAGALTSANTQKETDAVFAKLNDQTLRLLYLAPERLTSSGMQSLLYRYNVQLIAVDDGQAGDIAHLARQRGFAGARLADDHDAFHLLAPK